MRFSQLFTKTSKDSAGDAASANADLLTRAGFIDRTMAGVYAYLPLGARVLRKIENILREEMDKIGLEVFLPSLTPTQNWEKTGRLDTVSVLFQASPANAASKKTNDATYVLNSTHEEVITPLLQKFVTSYKDLPKAAYQIQTKFRNEARAKSGILRGREFRMKDLYSFHVSEEDMMDYFLHKAIPAYSAFFKRVGLGEKTVIALASGGDFSKEPSREFQTICEVGEDHIFRATDGTNYNREITPSRAKPWSNADEAEKPREDVMGEGIIGVEKLAEFLKIEVERTTKTLLFQADDRLVAVAVRGDYDVNEEKVRKALGGVSRLALATKDTVREVTKAEVGYAGPIGLPADVTVLWDESCAGRKNFECGANQTNMHSINVNFGRDVAMPKEFHDLKIAKEGDIDPASGKPYEVFRACEVGNVFTLYTKFSDAFGFVFKDKDGTDKPVYMGCYGIGTSRVMGVLAEMYHDKDGLMWPAAVAPATCHIVSLAKGTDEESYGKAVELYDAMTANGIECLLDDRLDQSPGAKFAAADLIGCPWRVVVSQKTLAEGKAEVKARSGGTPTLIGWEDAMKGSFLR